MDNLLKVSRILYDYEKNNIKNDINNINNKIKQIKEIYEIPKIYCFHNLIYFNEKKNILDESIKQFLNKIEFSSHDLFYSSIVETLKDFMILKFNEFTENVCIKYWNNKINLFLEKLILLIHLPLSFNIFEYTQNGKSNLIKYIMKIYNDFFFNKEILDKMIIYKYL